MERGIKRIKKKNIKAPEHSKINYLFQQIWLHIQILNDEPTLRDIN